MDLLTITQTSERRAIELDADRIEAIIRAHLAIVWGVPEHEIVGYFDADGYGRVDAKFSHEIVRSE